MFARRTIFLALISSAIGSVVKIEGGKLEVVGGDPCNVTNEGVEVTLEPGKAKGYWFGLIYYVCGSEYGYIVLKMNCVDCGLYCVANDYVEGCQNQNLLKVIGVVIGMMISAITALSVYLGLGKAITGFWHYCVEHIQARSDKRANKMAERIEMSTMISATPIYKDKYKVRNTDRAHRHRRGLPEGPYTINNLRMVKEEPSCPDEVLEDDLNKLVATPSNNAGVEVVRRNSNVSNFPSTVKMPMGFLLVTVISLLVPTQACDMNFYLKTSGKICDETSCHDINMFTFVISYGQSICFTDLNGEVNEFKVDGAIERMIYNAIYRVSDYELKSEEYWACKRNDGCMIGECVSGKKHKGFKNYTALNGYGCMSTSSPCDTYCYWASQCVYYHWNVKSVGQAYTVYDLVSRIWEVSITMKTGKMTSKATMNVNNPSVNMEIKTLENNIVMPMYVTGVEYERMEMSNKGILIGQDMISLLASESNLPVGGMVGHYQISLMGDTQTIDETMIKCGVDSCKATCLGQAPAYSRVAQFFSV